MTHIESSDYDWAERALTVGSSEKQTDEIESEDGGKGLQLAIWQRVRLMRDRPIWRGDQRWRSGSEDCNPGGTVETCDCDQTGVCD